MNRKRTAVMVLATATLIACSGTGGGDEGGRIPSNKDVLVVDLHTFMPTGGGVSADLEAITATQDIADDFEKETGIKIKWFTAKSLDGNTEAVSQDYIKAIQNGTMPAIGFSWSAFVDRGYYLDLSEYLDTPNEFLSPEDQALYPTWKDQFPSYVWETTQCNDGNGRIIAIPALLAPGPDTGWFYNRTAFESRGLEVPSTWNEFRLLAQEVQSPTAGPFPFEQTVKIDGWEMQFSLGPVFASLLKEVVDENKDGKLSTGETLKGALAGYYSPVQEENPNHYQIAQSLLYLLKDYYSVILPDNWKTANSTEAWSNGTAMLRQNGLWCLRAENGADNTRDWKYGVFPSPLVGKDSASFLQGKGLGKAGALLQDLEYVQVPESGEDSLSVLQKTFIDLYRPRPSAYYNLMKHGIYGNGDVLGNAVKFLKFLTTPENVSRITEDHQATLGGVKGSVCGISLREWLKSTFPVVPEAVWPTGYTVNHITNISSALNKWVGNAMEDDEFFAKYASELKAGAEEYSKSLQGE